MPGLSLLLQAPKTHRILQMTTSEYLLQINQTTTQGDAREESYYPTLAAFFKAFGLEAGKTKTQVTTLPKQTEAGNPDFRIWDGSENIVGYIEAKKPGENLDVIERSNQLKRYRAVFPNLILTDFYEFRLYRNGDLVDKTFVARPALAKKGIPPPAENAEAFQVLLQKFFSFSLPRLTTAGQLAKELALRTRFLRDEVITMEMEQQQAGKGELYGFYTTFQRYLIANLKENDFADLFSQTITYGLFAARTRSENGFNRKLAYDLIPKTIGILRNIFKFVSQGDLPKHMEVMVDDIAEVLNATDVKNILHQFYKAGKGEDPIVHFYETFLSEYDPATREKRGVYYTPEPVVRYIVRSIHSLLKTHFDCPDGLASPDVTVLDPAGGTLTFPAEAIKLAVQEYTEKFGEGGVPKLISNHILKNFYAFELMMAPYAIGHIKISFLLEEMGYTLKENERFKLYLTNTLDMEDLAQTQIPGLESLSEESHEAGRVKKSEPILVIMGNPPYSGHSATQNAWTEKLLKENLDGAQSYYQVDGKPLGEKNPKWLQDDYVKFLRFAQWKIHRAKEGIVGMITNHSYLDNPTFRGMRQSLMKTFNEIYIIDLHGNAKKKETAEGGGKDENVFDIQQGTAIALCVKTRNGKGCQVHHIDLYGRRKEKYDWLDGQDFGKETYKSIEPFAPFYFLKKDNTEEIKEYLNWPGVQEIFPVNSVGVVTARDNLTIKWSASEIWHTVQQFNRMEPELARQAFELGPDARDWQVELAQKDLRKSGPVPENVSPIQYRPFDIRFTYYTGTSRGFQCMPRPEVMFHFTHQENVGLAIGRQGQVVGNEHPWNLAFVSREMVDFNLFYRGGELLFPLYLYPSEKPKKKSSGLTMLLFEPEETYGRKPNLSPKIVEMLSHAYGQMPIPEDILYYCYGVLYSNTYRSKYAEFLKIDFPRIPFTANRALFEQMAELGRQLTELHLLKSKTLDKPIVKYQGKGDDVVHKPIFDVENERVYISLPSGEGQGGAGQYFEGITESMWTYHIGGYQVLEKYLKDRKGRTMEDPATYCRIATAISQTLAIQAQLDPVFEAIEQGEILS